MASFFSEPPNTTSAACHVCSRVSVGRRHLQLVFMSLSHFLTSMLTQGPTNSPGAPHDPLRIRDGGRKREEKVEDGQEILHTSSASHPKTPPAKRRDTKEGAAVLFIGQGSSCP